MPPTLQVKLRRFSRKLVVHCDSGVAPYCKLLSMEKAGEGVVTRLKEMGQYPRQGSANVLNGPLYCPSDFRMWTVAKGSRKLPSIDFSGRNNAPLLASVVLIVPGVDNSGRICTSSLVGMEPHQWGGGAFVDGVVPQGLDRGKQRPPLYFTSWILSCRCPCRIFFLFPV